MDDIKKVQWTDLYSFQNQTEKLIYNFFYDFAEQKTIFAVMSDNKIKRRSFPDDTLKSNSNSIDVIDTITKFNELNRKKVDKVELQGIYQNKTLIYLWTKTKIYVYKFNSNKIIQEWDTNTSEFFSGLYIFNNYSNVAKERYHLFFLTNRNVYCTKIEANFETYLFDKDDLIIKIDNSANSYKVLYY